MPQSILKRMGRKKIQRVEPNEVAQLGQEEGEHQMVGEGKANVGLKWNYKEMGVFLPASTNHPAVRLMKELTSFFKNNRKKVMKKFDDLCNNNRDDSDVTGIRYINGGRYELFFGARENQPQLLNGLC